MSRAMSKVPTKGRFEAGIDRPSKLVVAASGGLDSTVLLEVLHALGTTRCRPCQPRHPRGGERRRPRGCGRMGHSHGCPLKS